MRKFYFYIEPYVYSNLLANKLLLYNTFSYSSLVFEFSDINSFEIIKRIFLKENNRCIEINDILISNFEFVSFINKCKSLFMGDLIQCFVDPFVIDFKPKINSDNKKYSVDGKWESLKLRNTLHELTIIINNPSTLCDNNLLLETGLKQILFPCFDNNKNDENISFPRLENYLSDFDISRLINISIIGDIFLLNDYSSFIDFFKKSRITISLYYKDISENYFAKIVNLSQNIEILIWVDQSIDFNKIEKLNESGIHHKIKVYFRFIISNENEVQLLENTLTNMMINYNLIPFFIKTNLSFFEEFIYNAKPEILNQELLDRDLLSRMYINQLFYGNLFIFPNGDIQSNLNLNRIGNINTDHLIDGLKRVNFDVDEAWHMTRNNVSPCDACVFQFMCGPISNYEFTLGKMNLCSYNPYMNKWKGEMGYLPIEQFSQ